MAVRWACRVLRGLLFVKLAYAFVNRRAENALFTVLNGYAALSPNRVATVGESADIRVH